MESTTLNSEDLRVRALELREKTGFTAMDCKKALFTVGGDLEAAKRYLASGAWRAGKLVSWNSDALRAGTVKMQEQTGLAADVCREALMNAGGNIDLAIDQLQYEGKLPRAS